LEVRVAGPGTIFEPSEKHEVTGPVPEKDACHALLVHPFKKGAED